MRSVGAVTWRLIRKILGAMLTIGAAWQLYDCATSLVNGWPYAFPFRILVLTGLEIYLAMDFWVAVLVAAYILGAYDHQ